MVSQAVKYLRVAQREHYLPTFVTKFALRWSTSSLLNTVLFLLSAISLLLSSLGYIWTFPAAAALFVSPWGLTWRGQTSPLKWTRRLKTTALTTLLIISALTSAIFVGTSLETTDVALVICAFLMPAILDLTLFILTPIEKQLASKYVNAARTKLQKINPINVAITGSYGKTSTKTYLAHILEKNYQVLASPKSFNNKAGLARTINEGMTFSTEVFVAEMGTFGAGEIRNMCSWVVPKIAAITAVGPVHLERFRKIENIAQAKAEITEKAEVVVLNTDSSYLAKLAAALEKTGKKIIKVSAEDEKTDLCIKTDTGDSLSDETQKSQWSLFSAGAHLADIDAANLSGGVVPINLAVAMAIALELKCPLETIILALRDLPQASNRLNIETLPDGTILLDDTYNSNPAGAAFALSRLELLGSDSTKKIIVTPGMVELGPQRKIANEKLGYEAAKRATHLVVVKNTNKKSILAGAKKYQSESGKNMVIKTVPDRKQAVAFVKAILAPGDVVLYENDLPDHYP